MRTSFDKFGNYEVPTITLCNPSAKATIDDNGRVKLSNAIGILTDPKGTHLKLNFNAPHEVSFDYERHISENPIKQSFYDNIYNGIATDRYLFVETVGFYIITGITDSDEDGVDKKSVTAQSCEREHENFEGINIEEDTAYEFSNAEGTGLVDKYIAGCPNWTIKYIDPVLLYKNGLNGEARVYTFDQIDAEDGYKFLWETIQDGCECIVEPDILTRELSFYSRELYTQEHKTDILIAYFNLLKYRTIEEGDEDKWTALNVLGKDEDLRISMVNPTGMNTLYNFTYRYAWLSPELQEALDKWQEKIDSVEDEYYELVSGYAPQRDNLWNKAEDIKVLETELEVLNSSRDAIISSTEDAEIKDKDGNVIKAAGQTKDEALGQINELISAKQTEISTAKSEYSALEIQIEEEYEEAISDINSTCRLGLTATDIDGNIIFTEELLEELAPHIKATDYNDEYLGITENMTWVQKYEIARQLYDRAKSQMVKLSSGKKTVKIDTASFLFNERFKHFSDQLVAGAIINAEITKDTIEEWHLTGIDIDFDERKTDFTLGNKYDRSDLKSLYEDTLGSHSKAASDLKYLKSLIEEQQRLIDNTTNWLELSRTLTLNNILKSENQEVIINDRGYWGRELQVDAEGNPITDSLGNYLYSPEQIKIINNGLYITETNWTPENNKSGLSVAIGKIYLSDDPNDYVYGVNGKVIMGELLVGQNVKLKGNAAGIEIYNNNNEIVFDADDDGNLRITGHIEANTGKIGSMLLSSNKLYYSSYWQSGNQYTCWSTGLNTLWLTASNESIFLWAGVNEKKSTINEAEHWKNNFDKYDSNGKWIPYNTIINYANFYVTQEGYLCARSADIKGKITATSGQIGNWNLNNGNLGTGLLSNIQTVFLSQNGCHAWSGIGGEQDYHIYIKDKFLVNTEGKLYAYDASITGHIEATSGTFTGTIDANAGNIGGFTINNSYLNTENGARRFYIASASEDGNSWIATRDDNWNWTFQLAKDGRLIATNATITGTVTAGNGSKIGGLTMSNGILQSDRLKLDALNGTLSAFNVNGGSMILSNAARLSATAGVSITSHSTGNVSAPDINLDLKACAGATAYLACMGNSDGTNEKSAVGCKDGVLEFRSTGYVTYNGSSVFGSSSRATKENIVDLTDEQKQEVYNLLKNIPTKQYDYKPQYGKKYNYGFIIEDIEDTKLNDLLHITKNETNKEMKLYSTEDLVRLQLIVIQQLIAKVDSLEKSR